MGPLEANVEKMETQLKDWAAQIDGFAERTEKTVGQAKIEYRHSIDELKVKRAIAQTRVDEFKVAGNEKWDLFKSDIERAWGDLEVAFRDLKH